MVNTYINSKVRVFKQGRLKKLEKPKKEYELLSKFTKFESSTISMTSFQNFLPPLRTCSGKWGKLALANCCCDSLAWIRFTIDWEIYDIVQFFIWNLFRNPHSHACNLVGYFFSKLLRAFSLLILGFALQSSNLQIKWKVETLQTIDNYWNIKSLLTIDHSTRQSRIITKNETNINKPKFHSNWISLGVHLFWVIVEEFAEISESHWWNQHVSYLKIKKIHHVICKHLYFLQYSLIQQLHVIRWLQFTLQSLFHVIEVLSLKRHYSDFQQNELREKNSQHWHAIRLFACYLQIHRQFEIISVSQITENTVVSQTNYSRCLLPWYSTRISFICFLFSSEFLHRFSVQENIFHLKHCWMTRYSKFIFICNSRDRTPKIEITSVFSLIPRVWRNSLVFH